jgi:hypothetical protein
MVRKTYRIRRITLALALAVLATAWAAQSAPAFDGRSPDTRDAAEQSQAGSVVDLRSPDAREAAEQAKVGSRTYVDLRSPDAREAADQWNPGSGTAVVDARSPDARDAAHQPNPGSLVDLRSPDARDAAIPITREARVAAPDVVSSDRFNWGDFGLGLGVALGSMLLIAALMGGALAARKRRGDSIGPATT